MNKFFKIEDVLYIPLSKTFKDSKLGRRNLGTLTSGPHKLHLISVNAESKEGIEEALEHDLEFLCREIKNADKSHEEEKSRILNEQFKGVTSILETIRTPGMIHHLDSTSAVLKAASKALKMKLDPNNILWTSSVAGIYYE